jgi:hypothetical protein
VGKNIKRYANTKSWPFCTKNDQQKKMHEGAKHVFKSQLDDDQKSYKRKITCYVDDPKKRQTLTSRKKRSLFKKTEELARVTGSDALLIIIPDSGKVHYCATHELAKVFENNKVLFDAIKEYAKGKENTVPADKQEQTESSRSVETSRSADLIRKKVNKKKQQQQLKKKVETLKEAVEQRRKPRKRSKLTVTDTSDEDTASSEGDNDVLAEGIDIV